MPRLMKPSHIFVPYNGKIADIKETDTNKHALDLETALSEKRKIVLVIVIAFRQSGSGNLYAYPNEGTLGTYIDNLWRQNLAGIIKDGSQRLQYSQTVANDDFDMYCWGYAVEA